ncbi:MAG: nucleoside kinase [Bacteroidaceae bacterium]|nr:nucleoside kinase [Bacteroidaceae bacterium]
MLDIYCKNTDVTLRVEPGSSVWEVYLQSGYKMEYVPTSAKLNNVVVGLDVQLYENADVEFLDLTSASGIRTYLRSLCFVLCKAVEELFPMGQVVLQHPVSGGYYCMLHIGREVEPVHVENIKRRMHELVDEKIPFRRMHVHTAKAARMFRTLGMNDKANLLETSGLLYTQYYTLGGMADYYYGSLVPHTGFIGLFDVIPYGEGILLRYPDVANPNGLCRMVKQEKLMEVFDEHIGLGRILGVSTVGDFNKICLEGGATALINVAEAWQEKKIARIADEIYERGTVKVVLISGPSSSGKTTFSKRLSVQLMTNGLKPQAISLDDYFVNRDDTPIDENGEYDFESLYALDLKLLGDDLQTLLDGGEIELPRFNFTTGMREYRGEKMRLKENGVLILEGIHALNPELTRGIGAERKFGVYVSALTTIKLDHHNYIPTSDNRLIRRIIRDSKYRGYSAEETIARWPSVRRGEDKWIYPYQENADAMFNSALLFELAVLKGYVLPLLERVSQEVPEYAEAYRLRRFLSYFVGMQDRDLPPTSLLREFLGGSSFTY